MASHRSRTPTPTAFDDADSLAQMSTLDIFLSTTILHSMPKGGLPHHGSNV